MESQIDPVQILLCLVGGMSIKETSDNVGFTYPYVRKVMVRIRRDLDARSNEQAIVRAFALGYITITSGSVVSTGKRLNLA